MAYNGAATDTQTAMAAVLGLQGLRLEQVNQANQALLGHLTNLDSSLELAMANSLWLNQILPVRREFVDQVRGTYGAEVASLNFADPDAVRQINQWVSRQTRDRIPTILDTIPPDQLLFLLNAVYFKGAWTRPFNPDLTRDRPFTLTDGTVLNLPTMEQRGDYLYLETNALQVVSLPYGNQSLSLDIILPAPAVNLEQMIPQLTVDTWETWSQQLRSRPGRIQLPRFEMTYEANLIPALESLGMGMAFSDQADFSGLTSLQAMINQVRHRTYLEVTEKGTEAAAVTSVGIAVTSAPMAPEQPFEMVMDRPFAMVLRDRQSGTLLFLGIVRDPR
jgi:serpin B